MAEEAEDGGASPFSGGRSPSSPLPPTPSRHPLSSPSAAPSRSSGDLPSLSDCHGCGLHLPYKSHPHSLHILDSQWRVVLLCSSCLSSVLSAESCSYCFSKIDSSDEEDSFLPCRLCSRRVHLRCAPLERPYLTIKDLRPDSFACVDCCPFVRSCVGGIPRCAVRAGFLGELVKDASGAAAGRKKSTAAKARDASKRARNALDAVPVNKEDVSKPATDEELAIQLHLAMNGSRRISRSRSGNMGFSAGSKRLRQTGNCAGKAESTNCNVDEKVGASMEAEGFKETTGKNWLNMVYSSIQTDCRDEDQKRGIDGCSGSGLVAVATNAEKGNCNQIPPTEVKVKQNDVALKQELEICNQISSIELANGNRDDMRAGNGCSGSNFLDVSIKEEEGSCDESSSTKADYDDEKVHMKGIGRYDESNLVEALVGDEQEICNRSSSNESESIHRKGCMEGIYEFTENSLVKVAVKEEQRACKIIR